MNNILVKLIGWPALLLQADPTVFDRWQWLKRHLRPGPVRTLDAGCGAGEFTLYAAKIGNQSMGLSFDESLNRIGQVRAKILRIPNVQFITTDLRELDQLVGKLGQFDQIICLETIEHLRHDRKCVANLSVLLRPNGVLLLSTPFKFARRPPNAKLSEHEDGGHVRWGYTHEEVREIFEACSLEVIAEEYISGFVSQKIADLFTWLARVNSGAAKLITLPLRVFQILDVPLTRLTGRSYLCIGVVGVKRG